jgi:hypothetical protein
MSDLSYMLVLQNSLHNTLLLGGLNTIFHTSVISIVEHWNFNTKFHRHKTYRCKQHSEKKNILHLTIWYIIIISEQKRICTSIAILLLLVREILELKLPLYGTNCHQYSRNFLLSVYLNRDWSFMINHIWFSTTRMLLFKDFLSFCITVCISHYVTHNQLRIPRYVFECQHGLYLISLDHKA